MKFIIYEGTFDGEVTRTIKTGEVSTVGEALKVVAELGYKLDPFYRSTIISQVQYIDFGSWSTFLKVYHEN